MMFIRKLDMLWQEHLLHMDHLRSDVHLRTVRAKKDPLSRIAARGVQPLPHPFQSVEDGDRSRAIPLSGHPLE